ncbi:MAG: MBL fold metallo-hydrolase [Rubricoccaceae bacterium]|nr:MBL fold metallo-hydrolase [Rubricoccaceae bacterium]
MRALRSVVVLAVLAVLCGASGVAEAQADTSDAPLLVVLGVAQDGGVPQAGNDFYEGDSSRTRLVVSLGLTDPVSGDRWIFEATPDFPEQLRHLDRISPSDSRPGLDGIFLTHAHIGHYTGLMFLGHEVVGARGVPVYAMPRMAGFLRTNGPWSQLVRYENIALREMADGEAIQLNERISVTPLVVPHRQEFSEVVGFRIEGPNRSVLFIPDIDSWEEWDDLGTHIEDKIAKVDVAYLDATFYANGELPGRDMSGFPHPFITHSMERFADLPDSEKAKIRFIHLNHSNPALWEGSEARRTVEASGFRIAEEGEVVRL